MITSRVAFPRTASAINSVISCNFCSGSSSSLSKRLTSGGWPWVTPPVCASQTAILSASLAPSSVTYLPHRNAGHSKWQNIKNVKEANDMARSNQIGKYMNFMKAVIKEQKSADPKVNSKLAQIIQQMKDAKLSMAPVDRFLLSMQTKKDTQCFIYPAKGPGNCVMLIDIESSSIQRSKHELHSVLKKNKGIIADTSAINLFDNKGVLYSSEIDGKPVTEDCVDEATLHAIEAGVNDVSFIGDHPEFGAVLEFTTEPSAFFKAKNSLEAFKYHLVYADVEYIPKITVELEDAQLEAATKLYDKLLAHPDVQKVYVNIA